VKNDKPLFGAYFYPISSKCPIRNARAASLSLPAVPNECTLALNATPLFEGHAQPQQYCIDEALTTSWDDADPATMKKHVALARSHGIDFFIFDAYLGLKEGEVFHELKECIDLGMLGQDLGDFKFAIMNVPASPRVILPMPKNLDKRLLDFYREERFYEVSKGSAEAIVDYNFKTYWNHPNYLHIDHRPVQALFIGDYRFESPELERKRVLEFLKHFKEYSVSKHGVKPYVIGVLVNSLDFIEECVEAELDALTGYGLLAYFEKFESNIQHYSDLVRRRIEDWPLIQEMTNGIPFIPPIVPGFDSSPRGERNTRIEEVAGRYPFTPVVVDPSSEMFAKMMAAAKEFKDRSQLSQPPIYLFSTWNEITEGMALLPKVKDGRPDMTLLETVQHFKRTFE
jgi:hypothetical protein